MKIQFRQPSAGYCSVYLLANIFRDSNFLRFTHDERFKGCGKEEIDHILTEMGTGLNVCQVLYANQLYPQLPKEYVYSIFTEYEEQFPEEVEIPIIPYLLTVRLIPSMHHHVGVLQLRDRIYYLDPYKETLIELDSYEQFEGLFIDCNAVERLYRTEDNRFCILKGEYLGYENLVADLTL